MKKIISLFFMSLLFLTGCTSVDERIKPREDVNLASCYTSGCKFAEVVGVTSHMYSVEVKVQNKTDKPVEIVWDRSKINEGPCFVKGYYTEIGKPQSNSVIPPRGIKTFDIVPADNAFFTEWGWDYVRMAYPFKLLLCCKQDGVRKYSMTTGSTRIKLVEEKKVLKD